MINFKLRNFNYFPDSDIFLDWLNRHSNRVPLNHYEAFFNGRLFDFYIPADSYCVNHYEYKVFIQAFKVAGPQNKLKQELYSCSCTLIGDFHSILNDTVLYYLGLSPIQLIQLYQHPQTLAFVATFKNY